MIPEPPDAFFLLRLCEAIGAAIGRTRQQCISLQDQIGGFRSFDSGAFF
jgi:hypothetical protein